MEATTVGKIRIAVGMSVIVTVTLGGWLLAGTAGAARTAGQRVAPTVSNSRPGGSPSLSARAKSVTTVLEPGTIEKERFVKTFTLSHGALTLAPFRGVTPALSLAEQTILWATDGLNGTVEGVGYAD